MSEVIALRVVARPALIGPRVLQSEAPNDEHAHAVGSGRRVNRNPPFAGPVPQLLKGVRPVDLSVPPLDLGGGVTDHVAVQLKGVPCELNLRHGRLHKPGWRGKSAKGWTRKARGFIEKNKEEVMIKSKSERKAGYQERSNESPLNPVSHPMLVKGIYLFSNVLLLAAFNKAL